VIGRLLNSIRAIWDWLSLRTMPWRITSWEAFLMRLFFAWVVYDKTFPTLKEKFTGQPQPNGIAQWFDLTFFADPQIYQRLEMFGIGCLVAYVIGFLPVIALPYLAWFSIASKTLANSQGGISHSYQMVSLILLAQAIVAIWRFVGAARNRRNEESSGLWRTDNLHDRWAVFYSQIAIAACYVTAGITKLRNSDGAWLWNTPYLVKDLVKTTRQNFYAKLDPQYAGEVDYVEPILNHPMIARVLFAPGLLLELAAVLALLGRRWSLALGLGLIALHLGIKEVMHLNFLLFELCVLIFLVNPPYWLVQILTKIGLAPKPAE